MNIIETTDANIVGSVASIHFSEKAAINAARKIGANIIIHEPETAITRECWVVFNSGARVEKQKL